MSIATLTASAWTVDPDVGIKNLAANSLKWKVWAEVSVTDADGNPISDLKKSAWKVHVTDASGFTWAEPFTVGAIQVPPQEGFYLVRLDEPVETKLWVAPTACGISVDYKKRDVRGQVVVPINFMGMHAVQALAL